VNGTLHTIDDRDFLRFERRLAHPVEKVWRAVTDPAHLIHWFPAAMEMDLAEGAKIRFVFPGNELDPSDGLITELDPPRTFAFIWNGDPLRMELRPDGDGCVLVFTCAVADRPMAGSFATGWDSCLGALESTLAGDPPELAPKPEGYAERHDAYVAEFGLDEGTVRKNADGWTVRFERLLPHPIEDVWPELAQGEPVVGAEPPLRATNPYAEAGTLTVAEPQEVLEYTWLSDGEPAGQVRWELTGGHPAGTRVVLTQTGRLAGTQVTALAAWHTHLEVFAAHLRGITVCPWPVDRTEELRARYADAR
jgi:uncharacterized protein YndB with AHSA1/START domain